MALPEDLEVVLHHQVSDVGFAVNLPYACCAPCWSNTSTGGMELCGRLLGSTRLATSCPFSVGLKEKSVSWLLSRKLRTMMWPVELVFDAGGHRRRVTVAIHGHDMAGGRQFDGVVSALSDLHAGRDACLSFVHRFSRVNLQAALRKVV